MGVVVEALDRSIFDSADHPLDLAVGPGMLGLGQAMIDIIASAGHVEGMSPEWFLSLEGTVQLSPLGSVKWVPLSVRTAETA